MVKAIVAGTQPWAEIPLSTIDGFGDAGAMLRAPEKQYLYWLMRDQFEGRGAVLDLGPLTGGSTVCLAGGLIDNKAVPDSSKPKVESYDLFYYDGTWGNLAHRGIHKGDNFFEIFKENIVKVAGQVTPIEGDITQIKSYDAPIEVLFVDLAKSEALMCHVMKTFFPKVLVGTGIVIHQDYKFVGMAYLKAFQQVFTEYFELLPYPADVPTVAFRLVKPLPDDFCAQVDQLMALPYERRVELLAAARDQFSGSEWHIMNSSLVMYQCSAQAFDDATRNIELRAADGTANQTAINFYRQALASHPDKDRLAKLFD